MKKTTEEKVFLALLLITSGLIVLVALIEARKFFHQNESPTPPPITEAVETTGETSASSTVSTPTPPAPAKITDPEEVTEQNIFNAVNAERVRVGLPPLRRNPQLDNAARAKLDDMINNNYFAHTNPNPPKWNYFNFITASGYKAYFGGENLGRFWGTEPGTVIVGITTSFIVNSWKNSPTHYGNIIETTLVKVDGKEVRVQYTETGIALRFNVPCTDTNGIFHESCLYVTQEFAKPR